MRGVEPKAVGSSAIDPASVPQEIRDYAQRLTGDLNDPLEIYARIQGHFAAEFPLHAGPRRAAKGDPIVNFLLHSKAGHCEFFASAAAMMLTARGIPSRL